PVFLFRAGSLADALAVPASTTTPPEAELVRRYLMLLRDLANHAPSAPAILLGIEPGDTHRARKLSDDELEALQRNFGLAFEPRIEPSHDLRSTKADGWDQERFLLALLRDLDRQRVKSQRNNPK